LKKLKIKRFEGAVQPFTKNGGVVGLSASGGLEGVQVEF
jgi:hypothetical protein